MRRVSALDGVRGLAILAVVGFHAYGSPRAGFFGVDLFFVLSGFLITTLLLEEHGRTGGIDLRRFYVRRARRLVPALVVLIAAVAALASVHGLTGFDRDQTLSAAAVGLGYLLNVVLAGGHLTSAGNPLIHLWSLAEEEQFYLLWPLLLVALLALRRRRAAAAVTAGLLVAAEVHLLTTATGANFVRVYYAPDTHVVPILAGCLLAFGRLRIGAAGGTAALAVLAFVMFDDVEVSRDFLTGEPMVTAASCALIAAALGGGGFARALGAAPLAALGRVSYSLYLWHFPLLVALRGQPLLAVTLSLLAAALSYRFVEQPFRRGLRARLPERVRPGFPGLTQS